LNVRNEQRETDEKAEPMNNGEGRIAGEELDTRSQQLLCEREGNMLRMSFDESTEPLMGRWRFSGASKSGWPSECWRQATVDGVRETNCQSWKWGG
jgi:hypothetical protein